MTQPPRSGQSRVAVIGGGVAGLTAAHVLAKSHDVTLLEADDRLGGHAHTHTVRGTNGTDLRIDSGFIVHNERTYPHLLRLFRELGVDTQPTEMSMSITCDGCRLSYAGGRGLAGILAQPTRLADPRFVRMLTEVPRFHRAAKDLLAQADRGDTETPRAVDSAQADRGNTETPRVVDTAQADRGETETPRAVDAHADAPADNQTAVTNLTWGQFLRDGGFSPYFVRHFAIPLVACVWSCGDLDAESYPALHLFRFLDHHGMLTVTGSPTWRTVVGGSANYVDRLTERLPDVRPSSPVLAVERHDDGVDVRVSGGHSGTVTETYDQVVIATHADQALRMLVDATPAEKADLGAITYSCNPVWLHRDPAVLPTKPRARASWNYRMDSCTAQANNVTVSYWMNRLHGIQDGNDHVVTLDPDGRVDPATVTARMSYDHPIFTTAAVAAADRLRDAGGPRLAFAGAHLGWGFHEDGCRSGVEAAARLGASW